MTKISLLFIVLLLPCTASIVAQVTIPDPVESIKDLRQGYLVLRLPSFKNKIDTLDAMIARCEEGSTKKRLALLRDDAIMERDKLQSDYISAFKNYYRFSKVAYFNDHESRNPENIHFRDVDGNPLLYEELQAYPVFYAHFERTSESKIDALVIYDRHVNFIPPPFPNNFSRSGFNALFIPLTEKKMADWRVKKINKRFSEFWKKVN